MKVMVYPKGEIAIKLDGDFTMQEMVAIKKRIREDNGFRLFLVHTTEEQQFVVPIDTIRELGVDIGTFLRRVVATVLDIGDETKESIRNISQIPDIVHQAVAIVFRSA
ncbi:MAG: hypothetical protein UW81_C0006G0009 [Candidatus Giovannonibacteria bacterium GW2011_GWC2_44_9]|uniref:Uncharacterized protein n=3 Tax=Candidatus Giovannoniibacteriota TaxID=1752738 RepID=A0A0G1IY77_9BACT|nr:MAG: hypothetical protein UW49_C0004G0054 [Candidatus Giovannonibacteria bacterium GW2011_GWB1_44_23]KKT63943.1 MAG: hypothetical protein UW57_C0004G0053 [Candidatus Giovannonibacteria bacterium GW2011_GWA1_44_29]KKT84084.1 MAG: hypothetical protein UW81_C0006G0009 [Candidatus Giovannonibacteria bacterium GW2011_GWC2_44_9]KKT91656.1 MAG: hypothetical protein UW93_C0004G0054 [Parcubacteria group bacterium GW2011_GWC1_45_13]